MRRGSGVFVMALLAAAPLSAQSGVGVRAMRGFWVGMGGGVGQFTLSCTGCQGETRAGFAGDATVGYSFGSSFQAAVQFGGNRGSDGPTAIKVGAISAVGMTFVPGLAHVFVVAGIGYTHFRVERTGAAPSLVTLSGLGWQVGVGYERPLLAGIALTPALVYGRLGSKNAMIDGSPSPLQAAGQTVRLSVGLDWHWGPIPWRNAGIVR